MKLYLKNIWGLVFRNEGLNSQVEYLKDELKECNYIKENLEGDNDELETERANLIIENDKLKNMYIESINEVKLLKK